MPISTWHVATFNASGFTYSIVIHDWTNVTSYRKALQERMQLSLGASICLQQTEIVNFLTWSSYANRCADQHTHTQCGQNCVFCSAPLMLKYVEMGKVISRTRFPDQVLAVTWGKTWSPLLTGSSPQVAWPWGLIAPTDFWIPCCLPRLFRRLLGHWKNLSAVHVESDSLIFSMFSLFSMRAYILCLCVCALS